MTKWNSRKFVVACISAVVATLLLAFGLITPEIWKWAFGSTVGAYLASQGLADALSGGSK